MKTNVKIYFIAAILFFPSNVATIMDQQSKGCHDLPEGFIERFRTWYDSVIILAGSMEGINLRN